MQQLHLYIKNNKLLPIHDKMMWARTVVITNYLPRALFVRCLYVIVLNLLEGCNIIGVPVFMPQYKVNGFVSFRAAIDV